MGFSPYLGIGYHGGGEGFPKGLVHNPFMHLFTLGNSKMERPETYFFDLVTT